MKQGCSLKDIDIRNEIHSLSNLPFNNANGFKVVDEFVVGYENARIDIAAFGNALYGLEIKSDVDSFKRLPSQMEAYNKVFDFLYLVVGDRFFQKADSIVPNWWGILHVSNNRKVLTTEIARDAQKNKSVEKMSLINLLWKQEMLSIISQKIYQAGLTRKERSYLAKMVDELFTLEELQKSVNEVLLHRECLKSDRQRTRYADLYRSGPKSLDFRARNLAVFLSSR